MKPEVKLISTMDNRKQAWIHSRPGFDHSELDMEAIGSMDMSLNSLCMLTFEVTSSIAFRDWLFTIRPIFPWARSSRSAPLTVENTNISEEFGAIGTLDIECVLDEIASGVPQDQAREGLPLSMSTSYMVTMDFRTCCGMIKTMKDMDSDMDNIYGYLFHNEIRHIEGFGTSKVRSFIDVYMIDQHKFDKRANIKMALMSQMIRSSNATFRNELWNKIHYQGYNSVGKMLQSDKVILDIFMEPHSYEKLMKLRSHWFADWSEDMWGTMVGDYVQHMNAWEFWDFIPNGNGKEDPYYRDMISRVTGEEHNLPCPIMLEAPYLVMQRLALHGRNTVIDKYIELVEAGCIKDNPDNKLRKEYEHVIANK